MPSRFIVRGTDRQTGQPVRRAIEADSIAEAGLVAQELGIDVRAVHADDGEPGPHDDPVGGPHVDRRGQPETPIWEGRPSQWSNLPWFLACLLVIPIPIALWKYLQTRVTSIRLTSQRLQFETGVFSRALEEIELYRIKDTTLERSFLQRLVGLGTVRLMTSDTSAPVVLLDHLPDAAAVREHIRQQVESVRRARGVRELDVS